MCREKSTSLLPTCGSRSSALSGCPLPTRPDNLLTATSARCCARRRTMLKHEGSNSRLRKKSAFDVQPLKGVGENWVVPPGLRSFFPLFPALKRWAKLVRPSGAVFSSSSFNLAPHMNKAKLAGGRDGGREAHGNRVFCDK